MGSCTGDLGVEGKSGNWHAFETVATFTGALSTEKLVLDFRTGTHKREY